MPRRKGFTIAISGKGGTGKTMVAALLTACLARHGSVLSVDADADANLPEALGVKAGKSVGQLREQIIAAGAKRDWPDNLTFQKAFEVGFAELVTETPAFDLLVMGQPEEEGCYCAVNHILRYLIDTRSRQYDFVVIDCEAGLEHLSRRTTRGADVLLVVTDTSQKGFLTARRVKALAAQMESGLGEVCLLVNKAPAEPREHLERTARETGLPLVGLIPFDHYVADFDERGIPLTELPAESHSVQAVSVLVRKLVDDGGIIYVCPT